MQNNAHFIGPHQTAVAVATLVLIGTEWLAALHWAFRALPGVQTGTEQSGWLHCTGHFAHCLVSRQQQNAAARQFPIGAFK